jgi:hypothetical protein
MGFSKYFINNIKRGKVERSLLFFSAQNFLPQRKYCGENPPKSGKKHEKTPKKRLKNSQKTIKNSRKTTKNRAKNALNSWKNAKIKPFLAQKRASKTTKKHPKTVFLVTNTTVLQSFYKS